MTRNWIWGAEMTSARYDAIAVTIAAPHQVRILARNRDHGTAEAAVKIAAIRRGVETEFYTTAPTGLYGDGDCYEAAR